MKCQMRQTMLRTSWQFSLPKILCQFMRIEKDLNCKTVYATTGLRKGSWVGTVFQCSQWSNLVKNVSSVNIFKTLAKGLGFSTSLSQPNWGRKGRNCGTFMQRQIACKLHDLFRLFLIWLETVPSIVKNVVNGLHEKQKFRINGYEVPFWTI